MRDQDKAMSGQRDYDMVVAEYQQVLNQKYSGSLNQEQQRRLQTLKGELDGFGKERFRKISSSPEYQDSREALRILQEFNKCLCPPRRRRFLWWTWLSGSWLHNHSGRLVRQWKKPLHFGTAFYDEYQCAECGDVYTTCYEGYGP